MGEAGPERRATGRNAPTLKYDILTALGSHACAGDKHLQRLTLRFITLIVARYNWAADELTVGQREIAQLWSLDERSVKRDMARLRDLQWLKQKRAAARGRVAVYGLGLADILAQTHEAWRRVGSDFESRMSGDTAPPTSGGQPSNVISFPVPNGGAGLWARMQVQLFRDDPNLFNAWFAAIAETNADDGVLRLAAPTRFHASYISANHLLRLTQVAAALDVRIVRIEIEGPG